jgi:hypothetical protein
MVGRSVNLESATTKGSAMHRIAIIAAAITGFALWSITPAHADTDSITQVICTASRLGESNQQIVDQLYSGDARWNIWRAQQKVTQTVIGGECG